MKMQSYGLLTRSLPNSRLATKLAQGGVVLFIALMALVAMSLAAVALMRSVDTGTLIAGNLAFRQAATTSADAVVETAMNDLFALSSSALDPMSDSIHPLNNTNITTGYYSNADPALDLAADTIWTSGSKQVGTGPDTSGNTVRYIIQRMCQLPNTTGDKVLSATEFNQNGDKLGANCLLSDAETQPRSQRVIPDPEAGGKKSTNPPLYRVTVRVTGPRNTVSYVQAFVY